MRVVVSDRVILFKLVQPENIPSGICVISILRLNFTVFRLVQPLNISFPIDTTLLGNVISVSKLQSLNASFPIYFRELTIIMLVTYVGSL